MGCESISRISIIRKEPEWIRLDWKYQSFDSSLRASLGCWQSWMWVKRTSGINEASLKKGVYGSFRQWGVPYFGVLMIRILLFRVLY